MTDHIQVIEENMAKLAQTGYLDKHAVASDVSELEEFPYSNFGDLQHDLRGGRATVRLSPFGAGISSAMFSMLATPVQKRLFPLITASGYMAGIAGIGLAIFAGRWWWLVLLPTPLFTMRWGKRVYCDALFYAVGNSEKAFCLAYCGNMITVEATDGTIWSHGRPPIK